MDAPEMRHSLVWGGHDPLDKPDSCLLAGIRGTNGAATISPLVDGVEKCAFQLESW
jgi:hypothetical protein